MNGNLSHARLKEMAKHRGLKVLKSRRRTPGVGDYGMYGLTDMSGRALIGIGDDGLTASAADIAAFMKSSSEQNWKKSAAETRGKAASPPKRPHHTPSPDKSRNETPPRRKPALAIVSSNKPDVVASKKLSRKPAREARLAVRSARASDAKGLAQLFNQLPGAAPKPAEIARRLALVSGTGGGAVVAVQAREIVGCGGWAVVPTLHRGLIGRITLLLIAQNKRRRGTGRLLLDAIADELRGSDCQQMEVLSDIAIDNSHSFFRSLGFEQTSYRFLRPL
ncbi:GNAT family N-acetyltransferase [Altererythrobacter xixiisoli]|uniref:GNAT family N-acetyltransferase n=1 Tax=Croceibacterium xixiisoli TaxID=1476466 RepID=A0A6I4TSZ2_9SPHN|nr:GNAT family N-acetyltransferase [Croceibacterium xixiisoli]MXO98241.1 GNAT family N-acetyltransferase [Croceibacterium xixiisoli]